MQTHSQQSMFSSLRNDWRTPSAIYQQLDAEFGFDFDPCPSAPNFDGLSVPWGRCNFVNPPYSQIPDWIRKAWSERDRGCTSVLLVPARTDTIWWHEYAMQADEIRFLKGRLRFDDGLGRAPFPTAVIVFRGHAA